MVRGLLRTYNLPQLQNPIKRPTIPAEKATHFRELVSFISQVTQFYPTETSAFPSHLSSLRLDRYGSLSPDKRLKTASKKRKRKDAGKKIPAIQLLRDPQSFGEKLYDLLEKYDARFSLDHKTLVMQLLARVTALYQLTILGLYTYVLKYLTHHQLGAPAILAALAQSVHTLTPPDALTPAIRKLAHELCIRVSDRRW
ncbi:hypothetical protein BJY52DRAFT_1182563 [Lactarius psammicola]|nr:hypothetical protein BJY52DRAFT_1182563 [Lactarius psammicola]